MTTGRHRNMAYKLFPRTLRFRCGCRWDITLFTLLRGVEPSTDAQTLATVLTFTSYNDLFDRVKAAPWLHLEENKLIPARRDDLGRYRFGFQITPCVFLDWVELESSSPVLLPELVVRQWHIEDIRDATRTNDIVVVEQMAASRV